jgi:hypothetical protein
VSQVQRRNNIAPCKHSEKKLKKYKKTIEILEIIWYNIFGSSLKKPFEKKQLCTTSAFSLTKCFFRAALQHRFENEIRNEKMCSYIKVPRTSAN